MPECRQATWNISGTFHQKHKKKRPCRKTLLSFWIENFTQRWTQFGPFSAKSGHFFWFSENDRGGLPLPLPPPPPSCAPVSVAEIASISLNIPKYPWKCLNKLFGLSQDPEYRDLTCLTGFWRASGSICVRVLNMT